MEIHQKRQLDDECGPTACLFHSGYSGGSMSLDMRRTLRSSKLAAPPLHLRNDAPRRREGGVLR